MHGAGLTANAITYTAVLSACHSEPALVVTVLERMQRERVAPNTIMLTAAINVLSRGDEACRGAAAHLLQWLLIRNCVPCNYPPPYLQFPILICFDASSVAEKAIELYQQMETTGPAPNLFTYNVMMRTFAEAGCTQV
jgi:hypothetical protein